MILNLFQRTTVQAVLISGGQYTFVLMNYGIIASTTRNVQVKTITVMMYIQFLWLNMIWKLIMFYLIAYIKVFPQEIQYTVQSQLLIKFFFFFYLYLQAGYDTINSIYHFTIPGSFSSSATGSNSNFRVGSNVNVPGRWAFRTDHGSRGCTYNGKIICGYLCTITKETNETNCLPLSCLKNIHSVSVF